MLRLLVGASIVLLLIFAAAVVIDANAAMPAPGARAALVVTDQFVIPHYKALADAADNQVRTWREVCGKPLRGRDVMLRGAYMTVADRWAEIEMVKNGPMALFLRDVRINYWPEARNATQRDLDTLLAANDPKMFDPMKLTRDDIPAQGIPAMERLVYDAAYATHPNRCMVGENIAVNIARIAHDVLNEWTGPSGVRAAIAANKGWNNNLFANANEAGGMLLTDLVGAFTFINDQKLLAPMGASPAVAKPKLAEAWRSGRSKRNLELEMASLRQIARLFVAGLPAAQQKLDPALAAAEAAIKTLPSDFGAAVADPAQRVKIAAARAALKAAQAAVIAVIPSAVNVSMGFNSLDGD